jgi:hypothetical protein
MIHHRTLIIGTQPFNKMVQSRAFDSYFHYWEKENLQQIFSDSRSPLKGHCGELYQITDHRLVSARTTKKDPGVIFVYKKLKQNWTGTESKHFAPKFKPPLLRLIRKRIWNRKFWITPKLNRWVEKFNPEIIFLSFSRDFFIFDISFYIAKKFNIPIIVSVADDYVFDKRFSIDPFYYVYRYIFKKTIKKLLSYKTYWMFESSKILKKYESEIKLISTVQYIGTSMKIETEPDIPEKIKTVRYFGNLEAGRLRALKQIAKAFEENDSSIILEIYTKDMGGSKPKKITKNMIMFPQINYEQVCKLTKTANVLLIVESFKSNHIREVRYSLSTKIADCLSSGKLVLAYGAKDTGALSFLTEQKCCLCATKKSDMMAMVRQICENPKSFSNVTKHGLDVCRSLFDVKKEAHKFESYTNFVVNDFAKREQK